MSQLDAKPAVFPQYRGAVLALTVFLLFFPKGGFKLGTVPVTWGYLLLFAVAALALPRFIMRGMHSPLPFGRWFVVFAMLPFQALVLMTLSSNGVENFGFGASMVISMVALPLIFTLIFAHHLDRMDMSYLFKWIRRGMLFIAVFGIFLFFYKLYTGKFLEIPFLTVNSGDVGELEEKHIDRGGVFKLISTYNNGNIYGISVLMLLPLYEFLEDRLGRRILVKLALVLTLSRTVWLGLLLYQALKILYIDKGALVDKVFLVPRSLLELRVRRKEVVSAMFMTLGATVFAGGILYMTFMIGQNASFLFDKDLGGRADQFGALNNITLFSERAFSGVGEVVYLSILVGFGFVGLVFYCLGMFAPVVISLLGRVPNAGSAFKRSLTAGLILYLFLSMSDGALLYIPIMAFYWFLVTLLLSRDRVSS